MFIKISDQTIYYQKVGKGKNLIMLHGWGQDVSSFWGVVEELKENFTLWLIDLPGFGRSSSTQKSFTVTDYANTVLELMKKQKIKKPHLLGHSLGGRVSIKIAAYHGNQIDKLILEDAAGIKPSKSLTGMLAYPAAKAFKYLVPNLFNLKESFRYKFYKSIESDYYQAGVNKETLVNLLGEDLTIDLKKIPNDTLLIWGEKDRAVPLKTGKKMYRLIENSKIEVLDDVGHFPHLEAPEKFVYWVKDFLL